MPTNAAGLPGRGLASVRHRQLAWTSWLTRSLAARISASRRRASETPDWPICRVRALSPIAVADDRGRAGRSARRFRVRVRGIGFGRSPPARSRSCVVTCAVSHGGVTVMPASTHPGYSSARDSAYPGTEVVPGATPDQPRKFRCRDHICPSLGFQAPVAARPWPAVTGLDRGKE